MSTISYSHNQNLLKELSNQAIHHVENKAHLASIVSNTASGVVTNAGIFAVQADCSGTVTADLSVADKLTLSNIESSVDTVNNAYGDMVVYPLMSAVTVPMASTTQSSALTKPSWVKDIGVIIHASMSGMFAVSLMVSNDDVIYVDGWDLNYNMDQNFAYNISSQSGIGFKYYKFSITNNDMMDQDFTIQATY
tara:strand:- start:1867 stop:2445 length:579 start_codon:yes stop_codon:yes gene_type:complete